MKKPSKTLKAVFGKGFSKTNLQNMRALYLSYGNCQLQTGKLTRTHQCEILSISDKNKRSFYEEKQLMQIGRFGNKRASGFTKYQNRFTNF